MADLNYSDHVRLAKLQYLFDQKKSLNERTFQILAVYQAVFVVIVGGVLSAWAGGTITDERFNALRAGGHLAIFASSGFATLMIVSGLLSWLKYKREQILLESFEASPVSEGVKWKDVFRWYETYVLVMIWLVTILTYCFINTLVI